MKKVLLTAACMAAPPVGFSKGVVQLDVSGLYYGSTTTNNKDVKAGDDEKTATTLYGTTDAKLKIGAIDESKFLRFEINVPGAGSASEKTIQFGYAMPSNLYVTAGLQSSNYYTKTSVKDGKKTTDWMKKEVNATLGVRYIRAVDDCVFDTEFNVVYGVAGTGDATTTTGVGLVANYYHKKFLKEL